MGTIKIEVVSGVEGPSCYVQDHRVAGNKPWGGGQTLHSFQTTVEELQAALGEDYQIVKLPVTK